ncbi:N-acetylgalactosaminyltransferase 6-like [Condylostylus longicornis]|uniref:N-acetylgalactosaminyltransferase 6-like n=1 Tax=Condylostylus longicornis TaxID=2530218 RepID=UPI00244DBC58|nr:N-acetylgalactosaminyltransferase 6-like [Condylostylus longicornis]XP_055371902.1 N-acetylgalactosaminyltransferase 6-like [Condylostylus longicornis]
MRTRGTLCLVKLLIAAFIAITIGLIITSWILPNDELTYKDKLKADTWHFNDILGRKEAQIEFAENVNQKFIQNEEMKVRTAEEEEFEKQNLPPIVHNIESAKNAKYLQIQEDYGEDRIDWHDRNYMEQEKLKIGIGEQGRSAQLPSYETENEKLIFSQNGFNGLLSDKISLNRSLPDIRYESCNSKKYLAALPTVSIIIPFYNEHWSTLLRSVYSCLNRAPSHLIKEIILVDDCSDKEFLGKQLDDYVAENLPKVRVIHLQERSGLILARLAGARKATADVLIFLDSHIEANYNWLPPLLEPIALNSKTCVCPFIDVIDHTTFEYRAQDEGARGAFDWQFFYKRLPLLPEDLVDRTKPFRSPIMAGGLFAIGRDFFWELGGYDEGLDIWGGEQYELSFKIWMCGGEMLDAPCSRIGHIYRGPAAFKRARTTDFLHKNYKRVAEVWMDEYAKYLYDRDPELYKNIDAGDLTKQKAIRSKLKCKSFKWFMEEIAFDLPKVYPPVEPPDFAFGAIQSDSNPNLCLDTLNGGINEEIGLYPCAQNLVNPQFNQNWALSWHKDLRLRHRTTCLDVSQGSKNSPVVLYDCHGQRGNQLWYYDVESKWLLHGGNKRCLEAAPKVMKVYVNNCNELNLNMKWNIGYVNLTALKNYDKD